MGRIKTMLVKRTSKDLLALHREKFTDNFEENKHLVEQYADLPSKKIRNIIAGFLTRLKKREEL